MSGEQRRRGLSSSAQVALDVAAAPSAVDVFTARAEARALLWYAGEFDLHEAVDVLQGDAERIGLITAIGQDAVQAIMAKALAVVRYQPEPADAAEHLSLVSEPALDPFLTPPWQETIAEYHKDRDGRVLIVETAPERSARLRALISDDVSFERAHAELNKQLDAAASTLMAAEYLLASGDRKQFEKWLAHHSDEERAGIRQHFHKKNKGVQT
jgi:hypothetical protein